MSTVDVTLHVDNNPKTMLRSRIFGHEGVIIPFREGIIAKKCRIIRELNFYLDYLDNSHCVVPKNLVPKVEGFVEEKDAGSISIKNPEIRLKIRKELSTPTLTSTPYILMRDIADGFTKPAVLDIKLGGRTWALGANPEKVAHMRKKAESGTTGKLKFKVRAAMWYSHNPDKWPITENANFVERDFGNNCTEDELKEFLLDFFHDTKKFPFFIEKLKKLKSALQKLRREANARMYSSSVLLVYDEDDDTKKECRLLDFAKTYLNINKLAGEFNENVSDCEDDILPGIQNLINIFEAIRDSNN
ncbi:Inositol polyphosphate kinase family protein [Histomonas meleagridis]|uniref:Inositol polyphosphate kinase family protein n=1 Tax=Histomonas meleagridis TaxID=135588 RepID=UPI0035597EC6|nr:Inositol polyphosphate kinase family protein [Histomonas meleagridis]KAH0797714.1 Inositol polyphosphate kinase family protein [Histomonas meleagridis]